MASEMANDRTTTSPDGGAGGGGAGYRWGVAVRPTLLFMTAFALNATPHEAAHATASYGLGFSSTLYPMWVNPDAAAATARQLIAIAVAGPVFSFLLGSISLVLYLRHFRRRPSGLLFLMLAIVGLYLFLGPVAAAGVGGDFHVALRFAGASRLSMDAVSVAGVLTLAATMYLMGQELCLWAPPWLSRSTAVLCTTVGPWVAGTFLVTLAYLPLPRFLIASQFAGSAFWAFAAIGASLSKRPIAAARPIGAVTAADCIVTAAAFLMVRLLVPGLRLAH